MARSHVRLQFGLWRKPDHAEVSKDARFLYVTILGDEALNQAGVVVLRPSVWAEDAAMTDDEVNRALDELEARQFIVTDERSRELLIRTFIRNDGVSGQPNVLRNALVTATQIRSVKLRRALAVELWKLPPPPPARATPNGRVFTYPDPHAVARELDPDGDDPTRSGRNPSRNPSTSSSASQMASANSSWKGSENPSTVTSVQVEAPWNPSGNSSEAVETGTLPGTLRRRYGGRGRGRGEGFSSEGTPVEFNARDDQRLEGSEIPDDWAPHDGHRMLAAQRGLNLDHEAARFRDHALDKRRTSWNWHSAFNNWLGTTGVSHGTRLRVVNGGDTTEPHRDPTTGRVVEW